MGKAERSRKKASQVPKCSIQSSQDRERVNILDARTGKVATMPGRELASGMALYAVDGLGPNWMDISHVGRGVIQHPPFDDSVRAQIRTIHRGFEDVFPQSLEQWEDGFRRDRNPHSEIALWLYLADVYGRLTQHKSPAEKRDTIAVLLVCANSTPRQHVLTVAGLTALSRPEGEAVMAEFYRHAPEGAIKAIKVIMTPAE